MQIQPTLTNLPLLPSIFCTIFDMLYSIFDMFWKVLEMSAWYTDVRQLSGSYSQIPVPAPVALPPGSTEQLWARTELCIARPVLQENHLVARRLLWRGIKTLSGWWGSFQPPIYLLKNLISGKKKPFALLHLDVLRKKSFFPCVHHSIDAPWQFYAIVK